MCTGLGVEMECGSAFCSCGVVVGLSEVCMGWVFVWIGMEVRRVCYVMCKLNLRFGALLHEGLGWL